MMRRLWTVVASALLLAGAAATIATAGEGESLPAAGTNIRDLESLRRGAQNFMSYCSGCHSLKYLRYNRLGADLKVPEGDLNAMMLTSDKPFDTILTAMPADAETWFGKQPPDLSLIARSKGVDYIYAYLKDYYVERTGPWGVNNLLLPGTAMPAVLAGLQGRQKPVFKNVPDEHGSTLVLDGVAPMTAGELKPEEYDRFVRDIANFLDYAAEPIKARRQTLGVYVMGFLLVFFVLALLLKKEYWKDVH